MTAREILDASQLALLLEVAGVTPDEASPLPPGRPCSMDGDAAARLKARGLLIEDDGHATRTNVAFREVLAAAANPSEVLSLRVTGALAPGFAICRKGRLWAEVSSSADGVTHLEYPLSRGAMITAAAGALSSDHAEAAPVGFHFRGRAADGVVLLALVAQGDQGARPDAIPGLVLRYLSQHSGVGIASALVDPAGVRHLLNQEVGPATVRLLSAGHLVEQDGRLVASKKARAVLGIPAQAGFTATRTTVEDGEVRSLAIQVWRCGDRNIVSRPVTLDDGASGIDWMDLQKAELRALLAALYANTPRA